MQMISKIYICTYTTQMGKSAFVMYEFMANMYNNQMLNWSAK